MQPRLKSSRKWTALPKELMTQIKSIFSESFQAHIGNDSIQTEGRIYPEEILMRVSIVPQKGLKQRGFEVSLQYKKDKDNVLKLVHVAVDAIASLFEQLFASQEDHEFPRIWQEVDFEGRKIFIQYTTTNTALEEEANRLLGDLANEDLAQGEWEEDTSADQIKASLGIDPDDVGDDEDENDSDNDDDDDGDTKH